MNSPIVIQNYDPLWPQRFQTLRSPIAAVLGGLAAAIEHVGSTAVPGLAAKPVIDIDILLISASDLSLVIHRLASLGYEHRGDLGIAGRESFLAPPGDFLHHLYVCPPGSEEYRRHIAFRDYLRSHPEDADTYATLKRRLADKFRADREAYNQAKSAFVGEILRRAGQHPTL
ncbi:MAG TPA: GrpB family protein [Candidatus Binatus sp.]|nr:GrpB family protein [Candidatus Binatus sp.]